MTWYKPWTWWASKVPAVQPESATIAGNLPKEVPPKAVSLYFCSDVTALPAGTRYRLLADRRDLFGGNVVIELESDIGLEPAPDTYPNGVNILTGCGAPWEVAREL